MNLISFKLFWLSRNFVNGNYVGKWLEEGVKYWAYQKFHTCNSTLIKIYYQFLVNSLLLIFLPNNLARLSGLTYRQKKEQFRLQNIYLAALSFVPICCVCVSSMLSLPGDIVDSILMKLLRTVYGSPEQWAYITLTGLIVLTAGLRIYVAKCSL